MTWDTNCPCYEIINIQFEDDDDEDSTDSADSSSSTEFHKGVQYIDYFRGAYGPLANLHINSEDLGKNIDFDISCDDDDKECDAEQGKTKEEQVTVKRETPVEDPVPETCSDQQLDFAEPEWECPVCKHLSPDYPTFEYHFEDEHKVKYECPICSLQFASQELTLSHVTKDHMKRWACSQCHLGFGYLMNYAKHMADIHALPDLEVNFVDGKLECRPCNVSFSEYVQLNKHYRRAHGDLKCPICQKEIPQQYVFLRHMFTDHLKCQFSCADFDCDYARSNPVLVKQHCRSAHMPPRQCPKCLIIIHDRSMYGLHMSLHEDTSNYDCDICGATYNLKRRRDDHRKLHFTSGLIGLSL